MHFNDSAVCKEITPSGFKLLYSQRGSDRKGGSIALLFRDNISVHRVNCATFESFKLSEYFVTTGSLRFRLAGHLLSTLFHQPSRDFYW